MRRLAAYYGFFRNANAIQASPYDIRHTLESVVESDWWRHRSIEFTNRWICAVCSLGPDNRANQMSADKPAMGRPHSLPDRCEQVYNALTIVNSVFVAKTYPRYRILCANELKTSPNWSRLQINEIHYPVAGFLLLSVLWTAMNLTSAIKKTTFSCDNIAR